MTEFKTPTKFIFNNAVKRNEELGIVFKDLAKDELRNYLGLTLVVEGKTKWGVTDGAVPGAYTAMLPNDLYQEYLQLNSPAKSGGFYSALQAKYAGSFSITRNNIMPPPKAAEMVEHDIAQSLIYVANQIKGAGVYEDFNFDIGPYRPKFSVKTKLMNLNEYDIQIGDASSPAGALDPDKQETSLKFAYAFQTIGIQGSSEVIEKEVKVANNFEELFEKADNLNPNIKTIERLKHIVYGGTTTTDLKTQETSVLEGSLKVKTGDTGNDIGIDKLYNIIDIKIPGVKDSGVAGPPYFMSKTHQDFFWYAYGYQGFFPIGNNALPAVGAYGLGGLDWPQSLATYAAQSFFAFQIDYQKKMTPFLNMVPGSLPLANEGTEPNVGFGSDEFATTAIPYTYFGLEKKYAGKTGAGHILSQTGNQRKHVQNVLGPTQKKVTRLENYDSKMANAKLYPFNTWLAGGTPPVDIGNTGVKASFQPFPITDKLTNFSISNLFQGAMKEKKPSNSKKLKYSPDERLNNLFTKPQLIGFKVVKSRHPYNSETHLAFHPDSAAYDHNVIQTFYVNAMPSPYQSTVRIFDSQIIYGKEYYYTLFALYYVDGKFYYYDDVEVKTKAATYENHPVEKLTVETHPMLVHLGAPLPHGYMEPNPILKGVKAVDPVDMPAGKVEINPCCRYNGVWGLSVTQQGNMWSGGVLPYPDMSNVNAWSTTALGPGAIKQPVPVKGLVKEISSLLSVGTTTGLDYGNDDQLKLALWVGHQVGGTRKLSKETRCYLCRAVNEFHTKKGWISFLSWFSSKMSKEELNILHAGLGCTEFKTALTPKGIPSFDLVMEQPTGPYGNLDYLANVKRNRPHVGFDPIKGIDVYQAKDSLQYKNLNLLYTNFTDPAMDLNWVDRCSIRLLKSEKYTVAGDMITPAQLEKFKFNIKEIHARRVYEFASQPSVNNTILNFVPLPPEVTFVPLEDTNDKILIKFQTLQESEFYWQDGDGVVNTLNESIWQKLADKSLEYILDPDNQLGDIPKLSTLDADTGVVASTILARAEQDIKEIHAFKLDRTPTSRTDLVEAGDKYVLDLRNGETAYFSNLKPNHKYYYIFASRDVTGLYSGGTEIYQVEIIEDSGYSYTTVEIYKFPKDETKQATKSFKKLLKIKPSFEETLPSDATRIGSTALFSTIKTTKGFSGHDPAGLWPAKFKIRIRSKKTKRVFDINLKYNQDVEEIYSTKRLKQIKKHSTLIDEKET